MNIETFIARRQNKKTLAPLRDEQKRLVDELEAEKKKVVMMASSEGWKVVEKYIGREVELLNCMLRNMNPSDVESVRSIQSDIRAYSKVLSFIEKFKVNQ